MFREKFPGVARAFNFLARLSFAAAAQWPTKTLKLTMNRIVTRPLDPRSTFGREWFSTSDRQVFTLRQSVRRVSMEAEGRRISIAR